MGELFSGWSSEEASRFLVGGFFDAGFYLANNPDVLNSGVNPVKHYFEIGWKEGRKPTALASDLQINLIKEVEIHINNPSQILMIEI